MSDKYLNPPWLMDVGMRRWLAAKRIFSPDPTMDRMSSISPLWERLTARTLGALLATCLVAALLETPFYHNLMLGHGLALMSRDRLVVLWLLWGKSLVFCIPLLALAQTMSWLGWRKRSDVLWLFGVMLLLFWLVADVKTQVATGNHVAHYGQYLFDPSTWVQAGDKQALVRLAIWEMLKLAVPVAVAQQMLYWMMAFISRTGSRWVRRGAVLLVLGSFIGISLGAVPAHQLVPGSLAIEVLHQQLPINPYDFALIQDAESSLYRFRSGLRDELGTPYGTLVKHLREQPEPTAPPLPVGHSRPHVVVIVLESLRPQVWDDNFMPHTKAWAQKGLQLKRHYACANQSHLGQFALLFSRFPLRYEDTLDAGRLPPVCAILHSQGYECSFLTGSTVHWGRMDEFIRAPAFDRVQSFQPENPQEWVENDRIVLRQAKQLLRSKTPQFVVLFLISTHFPYVYPAQYERRRPVDTSQELLNAFYQGRSQTGPGMINRYANAASFLDEEVDHFLTGLDPQRHLIAMTGDHGESFGEDGAWVHSSRLSDAQTRVPMAIVGPGVSCGVIEDITTHADLMPTLLHAIVGRSARMPETSGRNLMIEAPAGQALLCSGTLDDWNGVLVRGDQRLGMKLRNHLAPEIIGLYSENGLPDLEAVHDRGTIQTWAKAVQTEWKRIR